MRAWLCLIVTAIGLVAAGSARGGEDPWRTARTLGPSQAGFSRTGEWSACGEGLASTDPAARASWTFTGLRPGYRYRVEVQWPADGPEASGGLYRVTDRLNDRIAQTRLENRLTQDGSGGHWQGLGEPVLIRGRSLAVTLEPVADGAATLAGAVRVTPVGPWEPPLGVPAPSFGLAESHWDYAVATYDFGAGPKPYPAASAGPFTHYVDNTHAAATDAANPFGTPQRPRRTPPAELPPGSVVEIHGGPYTFGRHTGEIRYAYLSGEGTAERPVFIRGANPANRPRLQNMQVRVRGRYLVVENLELAESNLRCMDMPDHVALRNLEVHGYRPRRFGTAVYAEGSDLVVYACHIHHNGDADSLEEDDVHATSVRGERIWIVDSEMHHNGGDSFQVNSTPQRAHHIYVARNVMHDERENAVDIKGSCDVIVSQNVMYGFRAVSSSDGTAIVGGHEGSQRSWLLFNDISDCVNGIRVNDSQRATEAYVIGNCIHGLSGDGVIAWFDSQLHVVGNTIHDVRNGVVDGNWRASEGSFRVVNNVFSHVAESALKVGPHGQVAARSLVHHNLFFHPEGIIRLEWAGRGYSTTRAFHAVTGQGDGSGGGDPCFVDAAGGDFRLRREAGRYSAAIDAGADVSAYDALFRQLYGLGLDMDAAGVPRPQGEGFDIGAHEHRPQDP